MPNRSHVGVRRRAWGVVGVGCAGLAGWLAAAATVSASPGSTAPRATVINVIAGKPSEFAFKLSRFSSLPAGKFTFRVKNEGATSHNFVLCYTPVRRASQDLCVGYQSKDLHPGQATKITIGHIGKGRYEFLSTDPGDAAAGMKGLIGIGVAVKPPRGQAPAGPAPSPVATTPSTPPSFSETTTGPASTEMTPTTTIDPTSPAAILPQLE